MLDPRRNPLNPSAEMIAELREKLPDQVPDEFESWPPKRQWDLYHNLIDKLRGFTEPTSVPKQKFVLRSGSNPEHSGSPAPVVAPPKRSEERRVGKGCRPMWEKHVYKQKTAYEMIW